MLTNGISIPPNNKGYLSGKNENFGVYSETKLSDDEFLKLLKFTGEIDDGHSLEWQILAILAHDAFMRPNTATNYKYNFKCKKLILDDITCDYYEDTVYEPKQKRHFPKWVFRKESKDILQYTSPNFAILSHLPISQKKKRLGQYLREFYVLINRVLPDESYKKVIDGDKFYLSTRPINSLRHSGAHYTMRQTSYNASVASMFGWDDETMLSKVYASITPDTLLHDGTCEYCDPPRHIDDTEDKIFCKLSHAIIFNSNGYRPKVM